MLTIQTIKETDFDRLFEIEQAAHITPWTMGTLKNTHGDRYVNLKLLQDDNIVAFAICQTVLDEATLFNIAVEPSQQGKGLGKMLLLDLIERLKARRIMTLWLEVRESNHIAKTLYEQLGFNEVDIRKNYYPTKDNKRENAIVMALYL
ncbi:ribosomal protein S18-alanine N-acetyltransferase [Pasteurella dagmatis]|uniref:[Ribosomal protein bS18]-alanine N-acetyltransferase n=1 Tax=Pasteurella dagmatis ATCC 43325 TaxID=667128 RepID=C9PMP2_9PAST|nr:ribosomal protein S18-alanine N-acetyltransferase [Pasteurella dagmatis]EEX51076.1 ribosomal-protein-alanine acetyltransferase [Pasteurella dagmatis ATCC 43325]SNV42128.1 ribosomal-protein-alanine N-acetyltransferase [Pasteurella dagmatis]